MMPASLRRGLGGQHHDNQVPTLISSFTEYRRAAVEYDSDSDDDVESSNGGDNGVVLDEEESVDSIDG